MSRTAGPVTLYTAIAALAIAAPWLLPSLPTQLAMLCLMAIFAVTWDLVGGQMGYNSFGNVLFFGIGAYACAVVQRDSGFGYYSALALGATVAAGAATAAAAILGPGILALRGHYFAIGTLGLGVAAADIAAGWRYIGGGSGMTTPQFPGAIEDRGKFFYYLLLAVAVLALATLRTLYAGRFGLVVNAIRDDEDKAEAMGLRTTRYKTLAWCVAAFFLGIAGAVAGNLVGYIDPREFAFAGSTFGVWMILMAVLGGRGTLWGPVIGAFVFHVTQEVFWTYLLGWQRVSMGLFILVVVVYFPSGIAGWIRDRAARLTAARHEPLQGPTAGDRTSSQ
jgi:branched-chain amino acid transport system permease protein